MFWFFGVCNLIALAETKSISPMPIEEGNVACIDNCTNSSPGIPNIKHINGSLFQIYWRKPNISTVEYSLDGLYSKNSEIFIGNETEYRFMAENDKFFVDEPQSKVDHWMVVCNTTHSHCFIENLYQKSIIALRVRAKTKNGDWSPYTYSREPIQEPTHKGFLILATFLPALFVLSAVFFAFVYVLVTKCYYKRIEHFPKWAKFFKKQNVFPRYLKDAEVGTLPEIPEENLTIAEHLGRGIFGGVHIFNGSMKQNEEEISVTIKVLQSNALEPLRRVYVQEAFISNNIHHKNIVHLFGVSFGKQICVIMENISNKGDLLGHLRSLKASNKKKDIKDLLKYCSDIANAFKYLEGIKYVHRDLACRNCFIFENTDGSQYIKIGDFSIVSNKNKNNFYELNGYLFPIRWMAIESLTYGAFTTQSNIWSFGVLCWEITTLGLLPFTAKSNIEVLSFIRDGNRLAQPDLCPDNLYALMLNCWEDHPENRPTFQQCYEKLVDADFN